MDQVETFVLKFPHCPSYHCILLLPGLTLPYLILQVKSSFHEGILDRTTKHTHVHPADAVQPDLAFRLSFPSPARALARPQNFSLLGHLSATDTCNATRIFAKAVQSNHHKHTSLIHHQNNNNIKRSSFLLHRAFLIVETRTLPHHSGCSDA